MASINYTPAQRTAVFWRGGNLLLSAAAGSGKTAALTGRICDLCKKGEDLHSMLVVTFTRAAAAEMRTRISQALAKAVDECRESDPEKALILSRAIAAVPSAKISTIHSFLYHTLKPYFPAIGLPQDSHIADQKMVDALQEEIMEAVVNDFFSAGDERGKRFASLADIIGQVRDTESVDRELLWLAKRLTSTGQNQTALLRYADMLESLSDGEKLMDSDYGAVIKDSSRRLLDHYHRVFLSFDEEFTDFPVVAEKYGPALHSDLQWMERGYAILDSNPCDYNILRAHFTEVKYASLGQVKGDNVCETSILFKKFRDEMKTEIKTLIGHFFRGGAEDACKAARQTAEVLRLFAEVLEVYFDTFARRKREMSLIDYGDLENLALDLLTDENGVSTPAALEIGEKYKYIFIDEYQDTNRVQDTIFRAISKNARRFMVGDIKQSIYRFRGAEPEVFSNYRQIWETTDPIEDTDAMEEAAEFDPEGGNSLFMSENFRCDLPVTRAVNLVSDYILPYGGINYEGRDALVYAKNMGEEQETSPATEIVLIDNGSTSDDDEEEADEGVANPEAEYVAERIASMIGKYSPHGDRIVKPGDIAILLRSPKKDGAPYRDALQRRGISGVMKVSRPLSSFPSVMLLVCILNFIDNPLRDVYVTGALRSPVFGFTMSELAQIKGESKNALYLSILKKADEGDEKCARCVRWLEKQKTVSRGMRVDKFLEYLIDEVKLYSLDGIRENGVERDAVNRFCTLAADFEAGSAGVTRSSDVSSFLSYAAEVLDSDDDGSSAASAEGAVSIMSIHSSKGLEFPVCFVSKCAKPRNDMDLHRTILYHGKLGFGMQMPDSSKLVKCDNLIRQVISEKMKGDAINEEMRMLYVALTRAREQLIITATVGNSDRKLTEAKIQAEFSDSFRVKRTRTYIDWILEAASGGERDWLKLNVVYPSDTESSEVDAEDTDMQDGDYAETEAEFKRRFEYTYPHAYLAGVPSKLTVSRLNPQILDDGETGIIVSIPTESEDAEQPQRTSRRPSFMSEGGAHATAADRGTATHVFMQFADFAALHEYGAKREIDRLVRERYITENTAKLISLPSIERFAESSLMDKLLRSPMVKREFRFNARLGGERFTADEALAGKLRDNGVKLTVQGVVDCVFRDPDTGLLTLIDYKTDYITEDEWKDISKAEEKLRSRHRDQLSYYREICSEMFGEDVPKAYVYSTVLGRCIEI